MARVIVWVAIALTPIVLVADYVFDVTGAASFVLSAGALAPLAFVIGEATETVAEHTGAGRSGLPNVVRGSLTGSIARRRCSCTGLDGRRGSGAARPPLAAGELPLSFRPGDRQSNGCCVRVKT